jgi:hypothetical protein
MRDTARDAVLRHEGLPIASRPPASYQFEAHVVSRAAKAGRIAGPHAAVRRETMKPTDCELESEVLAAVLQNRWPERVDTELRAHVAACEICTDVVVIAGVIDNAREEMRARDVVPDSGRVWWLARMRARREAAGRPITAAQVIAFASAIGLLGTGFRATSVWFQSALRRTSSSLAAIKLLPFVAPFVAEHGALLLGMATILLVVPAAIYLTMLRE